MSPDFLSVLSPAAANMVNDSHTNTDVNGNVKPTSDENANGGEGRVVEEEEVKTYTKLDVCFLCGAPATMICDKCGLVAFCSEKHQKLHRSAVLAKCQIDRNIPSDQRTSVSPSWWSRGREWGGSWWP